MIKIIKHLKMEICIQVGMYKLQIKIRDILIKLKVHKMYQQRWECIGLQDWIMQYVGNKK